MYILFYYCIYYILLLCRQAVLVLLGLHDLEESSHLHL